LRAGAIATNPLAITSLRVVSAPVAIDDTRFGDVVPVISGSVNFERSHYLNSDYREVGTEFRMGMQSKLYLQSIRQGMGEMNGGSPVMRYGSVTESGSMDQVTRRRYAEFEAEPYVPVEAEDLRRVRASNYPGSNHTLRHAAALLNRQTDSEGIWYESEVSKSYCATDIGSAWDILAHAGVALIETNCYVRLASNDDALEIELTERFGTHEELYRFNTEDAATHLTIQSDRISHMQAGWGNPRKRTVMSIGGSVSLQHKLGEAEHNLTMAKSFEDKPIKTPVSTALVGRMLNKLNQLPRN
jgi:hypothetical protein